MTLSPNGKTFRAIEALEDPDTPSLVKGRVAELRRMKVRNHYEDGSVSRDYALDVVTHRGCDAVGVVPYWKADGVVHVMLMRNFRPALAFRPLSPVTEPFLVEIVAGVLEDGEDHEAGIRHRAATETLEEAGFRVGDDEIVLLGEPFYTSPGVYTEKLWLAMVCIDPSRRETPPRDGTVMEELMSHHPMTLDDALSACRNGTIRDAKTEIALRRFADHLTMNKG